MLKKNLLLSTAIHSIPFREQEWGIVVDSTIPIEVRRANILVKKRKSNNPLTKEEVIEILKTLGLTVEITNVRERYLMHIKVLEPKGVPQNLSYIKELLENICRAHVGKEWEFHFNKYGYVRKYKCGILKNFTCRQIKEQDIYMTHDMLSSYINNTLEIYNHEDFENKR